MARKITLTDTGGSIAFNDGTNELTLVTPTGLSGDVALELPDADGTVNQVLQTDGAGKLSWVAPGAGAVSGTGTNGIVSRWTGATSQGDGVIRDDGTRTAINKVVASPWMLDVSGQVRFDVAAAGAFALDVTNSDNTGQALNVTKSGNGVGDCMVVTNSGTGRVALFDNNAVATAVQIQQDGTGTALLINQTGDQASLQIVKTGVIGGTVIDVDNDGTGTGMNLRQDGDGVACIIDSNHTGANVGFRVDYAGIGPTSQYNIAGNSIGIDINKTATGGGNCIDIDNDGTGAGVSIKQDGVAFALAINQTVDSTAVDIDKMGTGTGDVININDDGSGTSILIDKSTVAGVCIGITQAGNADAININKTASGAGDAIQIDNAGTGDGILVNQTGNARAIYLNKTAVSGGDVIQIDNAGTGDGIEINQTAAGLALDVNQSHATNDAVTINAADGICLTMTGAGQVGTFTKDNTGTVGDALQVTNQATVGTTLVVNCSAATNAADCMQVLNSGTGHHIDTNAGAGTPAHLTNGGIWTDNVCLEELKTDIHPLREDTLSKLSMLRFARYRTKGEVAKGIDRVYYGTFQDDLIEQFGIPSEGISPKEVAMIALSCCKALLERIENMGGKHNEVFA
jgi:hypothetical protein